jgi:hypothetical protein
MFKQKIWPGVAFPGLIPSLKLSHAVYARCDLIPIRFCQLSFHPFVDQTKGPSHPWPVRPGCGRSGRLLSFRARLRGDLSHVRYPLMFIRASGGGCAVVLLQPNSPTTFCPRGCAIPADSHFNDRADTRPGDF